MRPNWFIALEVPPASWFERIGAAPPNVRLFDPSDVHLTVAFLGPVTREAAEEAFACAPNWPVGALAVTLGRVTPMGSAKRAGALSVLIEDGAEQVTRAIAVVRDPMCDAASVARDDRPPLPHATIARISRSASPAERRAALTWADAIDLRGEQVLLARLALYTWSEDRRARRFRQHDVLDLAALA